MANDRRKLLESVARRGKYAPLYEYLMGLEVSECHMTFAQLEQVLGFSLPNSARVHRPWWANQGEKGGHSHALAWEVAGWMTTQVDMAGETLKFVKKNVV